MTTTVGRPFVSEVGTNIGEINSRLILGYTEFMAKHVTIKVFKRHGMELGFDRDDQKIILRAETSKKKRECFMGKERLINGSKSICMLGEFVEIICDGGVPFVQSGQLVMNVHG